MEKGDISLKTARVFEAASARKPKGRIKRWKNTYSKENHLRGGQEIN